MRWFGDNSALNGIWNATVPDILVFGGFAIREEDIPRLLAIIESNKLKYAADADFPIKYNLRDLKHWFEKDGRVELYSKLLSESKIWRQALIEQSLSIDYKIVVSCINFYSTEAEKIKSNKDNVARYTFANALQRVALLIRESNAHTCEVFLDWPDSGRHTPYTQEYRSAFLKGCSYDTPTIQYFSGPLRSLGFSHSLYFTQMKESPLLQFSDLIMGATRSFIESCLGKKEPGNFGVELIKLLIPKYRGYPNRIIGRGIIVAPSNSTLRDHLFRGMYSLRYGSDPCNIQGHPMNVEYSA